MPDANLLDVANFKLLLNGTELSKELFLAVYGITIEDELNLPSMFKIKFNFVNFMKGEWRGVDLKTFKMGDTVKVSMGIDSLVDMMTGEITSMDYTFGSLSYLDIRGYD
jgi:uncharacterized protein